MVIYSPSESEDISLKVEGEAPSWWDEHKAEILLLCVIAIALLSLPFFFRKA